MSGCNPLAAQAPLKRKVRSKSGAASAVWCKVLPIYLTASVPPDSVDGYAST